MTSCSSIAGQLTSIQTTLSGLSGTFATKAETAALDDRIAELELLIANLDNNYLKKEEKPQIIQASVVSAEQLILPAVVGLIAKAIELLRPEIKAIEILAKGASAIASKLAVLIPFITALIALASSIGILLVLGARVDALEGGISALSNDLSDAFGQIGLVKNTATTAKSLAESAKKDIEDLAKFVGILATTIYREVDAKIASLRAKIEGDIATIVARINEIQVLVNDIQVFVREILRDFLLDIVSNLRFLIQEANNEIAKVREIANIALDTGRSAFARVRSLEEELPSIRTRVGTVETEVAVVRSRLADIAASIAGLLGRIGSIEGVIPDIRKKAQDAFDIAIGVQREIPTIKASIPPTIQALVPPIIQNAVPPIIQNAVPPIVHSVTPPLVRDLVPPAIQSLIPSITNSLTTIINNTINNMNVDLTPVLTAIAKTDKKVDNVFQFVGRIDATTQETKKDVKTVDDKMGEKIRNGGLSGWMLRFTGWSVFNQVINLLTLATTIHNALQLSSAIGETLGSIINNVVSLFRISDSEGEQFDLSEFIGNSVDAFITSIIGVENAVKLKDTWAKANRIYQASTNVLNSLMSLTQTVLQAAEMIAAYTGKIGNALRKAGVVLENAYGLMNPQPKFNRVTQTLEALQNGASTVQQVTQVPLDIIAQTTELTTASTEFIKAVKEDDKPGNKAIDIPEPDKLKADQAKSKEVSQPSAFDFSDLFDGED